MRGKGFLLQLHAPRLDNVAVGGVGSQTCLKINSFAPMGLVRSFMFIFAYFRVNDCESPNYGEFQRFYVVQCQRLFLVTSAGTSSKFCGMAFIILVTTFYKNVFFLMKRVAKKK